MVLPVPAASQQQGSFRDTAEVRQPFRWLVVVVVVVVGRYSVVNHYCLGRALIKYTIMLIKFTCDTEGPYITFQI